MRLYGIVLGMLLLCSGWSQADELPPGALGTRAGTPLRTVAPSSGGYAWLQMTLALLLVAAGLRYGLPRLIGWASKAGIGSRLDGEIRVLESRTVPGGSLLMVKARDRLLLIGATPQGMQLLADLTDTRLEQVGVSEPSEFERMLCLRERTRGSGSSPHPNPPRGRGGSGAHRQESAHTVGMRPMNYDLQREVALALQAQLEQARARLTRVAQQEAA